MARLIEDKNLIEYIKSEELARRVIRSKDSIRDILIEVINEQPTVDAVEVVRGEWERIPYSFAGGYRCSCCGHKTLERHWNYCPDCGADMRGIKNE